MDKRYQVFVSSTFEDLQEERKEVMQALLELDCIPASMELFPASNDDQWSLIKRVIDDCDYYILIIGGRYGSENTDSISYTEMEFEYALSVDKPIISFLHKQPDNLPVKRTDDNDEKKKKLENFKTKVQTKLVRFWETPKELGGVVSRSMIKLIKDFPAEGWVKAGSATDESSLKEIARLQKENKELVDKLNNIAIEAPKGTEELAQGQDKIDITYEYKNIFNDRIIYTALATFTWDDIFACVAPKMIDECEEVEFHSALNKLCESQADKNDFDDFDVYDSEIRCSLKEEDFNLIKVQLKALGLIRLSDKKRVAKTNLTFWALTPYGENVMTKLLAIKKKK